MKNALWTAAMVLAALGLLASVARAWGVFESFVLMEGPPPELSPLDRGSTHFIGPLLGVEPGTALYRDAEEQNRRFLGKFNRNPVTSLLHVVPAAIFMLLAPLQFSQSLRTRRPRWHRWSGRVVLLIAIPIAISGLYFGVVMPFSGLVEATAVALFGCIFLFAIIRGFLAIRRRDLARHREWMIRMFAIALGVSTVRIAGTLLAVLTREGPEIWFGPSVWIGFGLTFLVAEMAIRQTRLGAAGPILA